MQRKIFSVNPRIPQVTNKLGKLITFLFLFVTTVCTHIIFTANAASADDRVLSPEENQRGIAIFCLVFVGIPVAVIVISLLAAGANGQESKKREEQYMAYYASLSPEEKQRERAKTEQDIANISAQIAQIEHQEKQQNDHQKFPREMEEERVARENKIRDFRNRRGREPNSWEI
jgi:hypothetical protein